MSEPGRQVGPQLRALNERIAELEGKAGASIQVVRETEIERTDAKTRRGIATSIMAMFVAVVLAGMVILVIRGFNDNGAWAEVTKEALDLIKSTVLPVVTLVLGYYFGKSEK